MFWPLSIVTSPLTQRPGITNETPKMDSTALRTHGTQSPSSNLPDFPTLLSHLSDAANAAWPSQPPAQYSRVKVLLMSWENDDLEFGEELKPLAALFEGQYHFDTETWKIPLRRSAAELSRKIASIVRTDGQAGTLLVFYYGGHARANDHVGGRPIWFAK